MGTSSSKAAAKTSVTASSIKVDVTPTQFGAFAAADAKGGCTVVPAKTAMVCIEFQNEFTTEGGKLFPAVKGCMESTGMLKKTVDLAAAVRAAGGKVMHAPIMFKADASDNPNKSLGILAGCAKDSLFTEGTWNAEFCEAMTPKAGDVTIKGKKVCRPRRTAHRSHPPF